MSTEPKHHTPATLPTELLLLITAHLSICDISTLSRTCHTLHALLTPTLSACFRAEAHHILIWSARRNNPIILRRALATNVPIPPIVDDDTLLCEAVKAGREHTVRVLLEHGVDPDYVSPQGMTPLLRAVLWQHVRLVQLLLEAGADPRQSHRYFVYSLPLVVVAEKYANHEVGVEMVRLLKQYGAESESEWLERGGQGWYDWETGMGLVMGTDECSIPVDW